VKRTSDILNQERQDRQVSELSRRADSLFM
jgi:hypothetical protein